MTETLGRSRDSQQVSSHTITAMHSMTTSLTRGIMVLGFRRDCTFRISILTLRLTTGISSTTIKAGNSQRQGTGTIQIDGAAAVDVGIEDHAEVGMALEHSFADRLHRLFVLGVRDMVRELKRTYLGSGYYAAFNVDASFRARGRNS